MQPKQNNESFLSDLDFYDVIINIESLLALKEGYVIDYSQKGYDHYQTKKMTNAALLEWWVTKTKERHSS